jgi:hypothetical protein
VSRNRVVSATRLAGARVRRLLALFLIAGVIAIAPSPPAQSRSQNAAAADDCWGRCSAQCRAGSNSERKLCETNCTFQCNARVAHPTATFERAPEADAQVCCKTPRGLRSTYTWMNPNACKPPKHIIMESSAKCPLLRGQ